MLLSHTDSGSKVGSSFSSSTSEARQEIIGIRVPNHSASTRGGLDQLQLDWCEAFVGLTSECTVTCTAAAATLTLILINCGRFVSNRIWLLLFVMPLVCSKQRQYWRALLQEQRVGGRSIFILKKLLGLQSYNQVRVKFECFPTSLLFSFYRKAIKVPCCARFTSPMFYSNNMSQPKYEKRPSFTETQSYWILTSLPSL